jgi:hypothetical protein
MAPPRNYTMQLFSVLAESLLMGVSIPPESNRPCVIMILNSSGVYGSLVILIIWILVYGFSARLPATFV